MVVPLREHGGCRLVAEGRGFKGHGTTGVDTSHQCLPPHGHCGETKSMPHQPRMRDVMGLEIGDGTAQI